MSVENNDDLCKQLHEIFFTMCPDHPKYDSENVQLTIANLWVVADSIKQRREDLIKNENSKREGRALVE